MRYQKHIHWTLEPIALPKLLKACSKCGQDATYCNTEKFRVNANKKNLDIWLIYACEKCKSTYNLSIYERISPKLLPKNQLEAYMRNDLDQVQSESYHFAHYHKNNVQYYLEDHHYSITGDLPIGAESIGITLTTKHPTKLRLDKALAQKLNLSRSRIDQAFEANALEILTPNLSPKSKVNDPITFVIKNPDLTLGA